VTVTNSLAAVFGQLTENQQGAIVTNFTRVNPQWDGAQAADIIDELANTDSDLDRTEPFFADHPHLLVDGAGYAARALIWAGDDLTEEAMTELLTAAGLLAELRRRRGAQCRCGCRQCGFGYHCPRCAADHREAQARRTTIHLIRRKQRGTDA
jgi:hypothetical protein